VKSLAIAICCALLSTAARSSVKVERIVPHECSQFLRVAVTLDGKPLSGAEVAFRRGFQSDGKPELFSVRTKGDGIASAPKLAPGDYRLEVTFNGIRSEIFDESVTTNLFLYVAPKLDMSTVPVDLAKPVRELWDADEAFEKQLDALAFSPVHDRVRTFVQTIVDPTGAKVTSAKTWVVEKTLQGWVVLLQGISDANGHVSGQLRNGRYIAICSTPGFRTAIAPFEVAQDGTAELRIVLQIGAVTE
jgi:WD40 repeat protein